MKKLLVSFALLFALVDAYNNNAQAQVQLHIDSLLNFPDTAIVGQTYPVAIRVKNVGNTPYQGPLIIMLRRDSLFKQLYFNGNPAFFILPNDTVTLFASNAGTQGFIFDSTVFRAGNNVVVVWPYSSQSIIIDSLTTNVYVEFTTGIRNKYYDNSLILYPNPFKDEIRFDGLYQNEIDRVRIFNLQGIKLYDEKLINKLIKIEKLSAGCYLLDAETRDGLHLYRKIIKE